MEKEEIQDIEDIPIEQPKNTFLLLNNLKQILKGVKAPV
jgi:hypothetical protein